EIREGRQGQRRTDVRSQNTTIGMPEIDVLNVLYQPNPRGQNRSRVVDGHQLSPTGEAIVWYLGHLFLWFWSRGQPVLYSASLQVHAIARHDPGGAGDSPHRPNRGSRVDRGV